MTAKLSSFFLCYQPDYCLSLINQKFQLIEYSIVCTAVFAGVLIFDYRLGRVSLKYRKELKTHLGTGEQVLVHHSRPCVEGSGLSASELLRQAATAELQLTTVWWAAVVQASTLGQRSGYVFVDILDLMCCRQNRSQSVYLNQD